MDITCPSCGHNYINHDNLFGKICMHCGFFIESGFELPMVKENKQKHSKCLEEARESIRRKFLGENYDYKK